DELLQRLAKRLHRNVDYVLFTLSKEMSDLAQIDCNMMEELISWGDFEKVDLRVGTVLSVEDFPKARRPAYQLAIDFGEEIGILKSSAQITVHYSKTDLIGKQVVAVVDFPKKQIANFMSACLVT